MLLELTIINQEGDSMWLKSFIASKFGGSVTGSNRTDRNGNVKRAMDVTLISKNTDAFGRLRVSGINNVFESTHVNSEQTEFWDHLLVGGASKTYVQGKARIELACGTASGDRAMRQTLNRFHYAAGESLLVRLTGVLGSGKVNVSQCCGYYDDDNGLIFIVRDTVFNVMIRSNVSGSVVENIVPQSQFNGDKLDGTGVSGITLDLDKTHIFEINFQWLGVGRVSFYLHINGEQIRLHTFFNANLQDTVYMRTPHLPVRYEIKNTGVAASPTTSHQICTQIANEGKSVVGDLVNSVDNGTTSRSLNSSTFEQLISFRAKLTADILIQLENVNVLVTTSDDLLIEVRVDQTLTGASWVSDSDFIEKDVSATAVTDDGRRVTSFYISKAGKQGEDAFKDKFRLGEFTDGTKQTVTVSAKSVATNASAMCSVSFKEFF